LGEITPPKNASSESEILMLDELCVILKRWKLQCPSNKWLFPSPYKKDVPITPYSWRKDYFNPLKQEYGLECRFHDLRHLGGTLFRRLGFELDELKDQMRHASITTTVDIYGNIDKEQILKKLEPVNQYINTYKNKGVNEKRA
jgi:integrase